MSDVSEYADATPSDTGTAEYHTKTPIKTLLNDLKRVANSLDKTPTRREYDQHGNYASYTIQRRFESWGAVIDAAGLERYGQWATREDVTQDIQRVAGELGESPTQTEYYERGRFGSSVVDSRFGCWTAAVEAAGLDPRSPSRGGGSNAKYADLSLEDVGLSPHPTGGD